MSDTNVGLGTVPCRKNCRCDECTIERLEAQHIADKENAEFLNKRVKELEAALNERSRHNRVIVNRTDNP